MNKIISALAIVGAFLCLGLTAGAANAQATRTWVSGVGDDANPCSRTAPCKTFAGAISKTAAAGEINCLDPGGFGAVTITKAIAIKCDGVEGGVLVSGTNGIVVNVPSGTIVFLSGLDFEGLTSGVSGVLLNQGGALHIENCTIRGFSTAGVKIAPTTGNTAQLFISNSIIVDNGFGASAVGVLLQPVGTASVTANIKDTRVEYNHAGIKGDTSTGVATGTVNVSIDSSVISGQDGAGVVAVNAAGTGAVSMTVLSSTISNNQQGVAANGLNTAVVRVGFSAMNGNTTAFAPVGSGLTQSYSNNEVDGNGAVGTASPIGFH